MNLHEYQAKSLLAGMGMPCPKEIAIQQISQLADAWQHIACPSKGAVLKAQVHAGGRGKAGGVKVLKQLPEAQAFVQQMLGSQLVTYQTGPEGQYVSSILLCETSIRYARNSILAWWWIVKASGSRLLSARKVVWKLKKSPMRHRRKSAVSALIH